MPQTALNPAMVIATIRRLRDRITERFPDATLALTGGRLLSLAATHAERSEAIARPNTPLRLIISVFLALIPAGLSYELFILDFTLPTDVGEFVALLQASLETLFFIGAFVVFLFTLENRLKRNRALAAMQDLHVLAHLVDMHQLDKDPVYLLHRTGATPTASSPERSLTPFQLNRYLDYCSELLSLIGKVAALYAHRFSDPVALEAVDQLEDLCTGLSRKIWQKVMLLERASA